MGRDWDTPIKLEIVGKKVIFSILMILNLQSSKYQKKCQIDHLQMILTKQPEHLTQDKKNCGWHEHSQGGAEEGSSKKYLYDNIKYNLDNSIADSHTLYNVFGQLIRV